MVERTELGPYREPLQTKEWLSQARDGPFRPEKACPDLKGPFQTSEILFKT